MGTRGQEELEEASEDGGPKKRDGNYGQGWAGEHGLDRGAGNMEKSKPGAERSRERAEKHRTAESTDRCGARTERTGKSIGNSILSTRDVDDVTGKLRDIGEVALLPGRPKQRGAEQGIRGLWSVKRVNSQPSRRKQK